MAAALNNKTFDETLEELLGSFGQLPGLVGRLGDAAERMISAFQPVVAAIEQLTTATTLSATKEAKDTAASNSQKLLITSMDRLTVSNYRLLASVDRLIAILSRTAQAALPQGKPTDTGGEGGSVAASGASGLGKIAAVAAIAAAAIGALALAINFIEKEFNRLKEAVRLFNPAVIELFERELSNLGATIGRAFVPVFQNATEVVRQIGNTLQPIMAALVPIIQRLSDSLSNVLLQVFDSLASIIRSIIPSIRDMADGAVFFAQSLAAAFAAFTPVIRTFILIGRTLFELTGIGFAFRIVTKAMESFAQVMKIVDEYLTIFQIVVGSLTDALADTLQSTIPFHNAMNSLAQSVQFVIRNLYLFAVSLARAAGFNELADSIIKSVEDRAKAVRDTAAQQPSIKGLEQLSKDLNLAAASASGAGSASGVKNQQEFWQNVLRDLQAARNNGEGIAGQLREIVRLLGLLTGQRPTAPPGSPAPGAGGLPGLGGFIGGLIGGPLGGFIGGRLGGSR